MQKLLQEIYDEWWGGDVGYGIGETDNWHHVMVDEHAWEEWMKRIEKVLKDEE